MTEDFSNLKKISEAEYGDMIQIVLVDLLTENGFEIFREDHKGADSGLDFLAKWSNEQNESYSIGIEYKYFKEPKTLGREFINQTITRTQNHTLDKLLIISNCRLDEKANKHLKENLKDVIEYQKFNTFKKWVESIKDNFKIKYSETDEQKLIKARVIQFCENLIRDIANYPKTLNEIEWRDLERALAIALEGIGFEVELTPSSKDGGKDIIADCRVNGIKKSFIIEIKHWRSNQKVGTKIIKDFVEVVVNEKRDKGLILATNGYIDNYLNILTTTKKKKIEFAEKPKIIEICQTYEKRKNGIYLPVNLET